MSTFISCARDHLRLLPTVVTGINRESAVFFNAPVHSEPFFSRVLFFFFFPSKIFMIFFCSSGASKHHDTLCNCWYIIYFFVPGNLSTVFDPNVFTACMHRQERSDPIQSDPIRFFFFFLQLIGIPSELSA